MSKKKEEKKDAVAAPEKGLATIPEMDYGDAVGDGFENTTKDDYAIPFLEVLQAQSKKLEEVDDAEPGMMLDTVSKELYEIENGIPVIPVMSEHKYVEWKPRDSGGGYVGSHEITSDIVQKAKEESEKYGAYKTENGNDLIETFYIYGSIPSENREYVEKDIMIAFKSSHIPAYKVWRSLARQAKVKSGGKIVTPPFYSHVFRLKTFLDTSNTKGNFYNFKISWDGPDHMSCLLAPDNPLYLHAMEFKKPIQEGEKKVDYSGQGEDETKE